MARDFVLKELVPKLEGEPYGLKFYLCERNVGSGDHSLIAEAIVQRCKKFVVILSSGLDDGDRSIGTSFELDVAVGNFSGTLDDTSLKKQKLYKFGLKICMSLSFDLAVDSLFSKLNKPEEEL